jgi:hypothetical protein
MFVFCSTSQRKYLVLRAYLIAVVLLLEFLKSALIVVLLIFAVCVVLFVIWPRWKYPHYWRGKGYSVRILQGDFGSAWVQYEQDDGGTLILRTDSERGSRHLNVQFEQENYLAPDYQRPISEERLGEIQGRISEGLAQLKVPHGFVRLGWTSIADSTPQR